MRKPTCFYLAVLLGGAALGLPACQPDQPTDTAARQQVSPAASAAESTLAAAAADTLHVVDSLGHRVGILRLFPSTEAAFAKLPAGPLPARPSDQANVPDAPQPADGRVQCQG